MYKSRIKIPILILIIAVMLSTSAFAATIGGGTVNASALNLRSEPDTSAPVKTVAPRGAVVVVSEKVNEDWYKVWYKGVEGYMSSEYISFSETLDGSFGYGTIKGTTVRLRSGASMSASTIGYYNSGTQMTVMGVSGPWYKVAQGASLGYVHSDYMTLTPTAPQSSSSSAAATTGTSASQTSAGQTIVDTAKKYLGVPYVWGGTSPSGFDCSGFVYYVFKECGYKTNRTAASLYQNGVAVAKSELMPGDVICFGYGSSITHTGIYIGDDQFIHASSGSAGSVTITSLSATYYANRYYGARRIV